jgi:hypothetical protein
MPTPEESQRMVARLRDSWEALVDTDGNFISLAINARA